MTEEIVLQTCHKNIAQNRWQERSIAMPKKQRISQQNGHDAVPKQIARGQRSALFAERIIDRHAQFDDYDVFYRNLVFLDKRERQVVTQTILRQTIQNFHVERRAVYNHYFRTERRVFRNQYFHTERRVFRNQYFHTERRVFRNQYFHMERKMFLDRYFHTGNRLMDNRSYYAESRLADNLIFHTADNRIDDRVFAMDNRTLLMAKDVAEHPVSIRGNGMISEGTRREGHIYPWEESGFFKDVSSRDAYPVYRRNEPLEGGHPAYRWDVYLWDEQPVSHRNMPSGDEHPAFYRDMSSGDEHPAYRRDPHLSDGAFQDEHGVSSANRGQDHFVVEKIANRQDIFVEGQRNELQFAKMYQILAERLQNAGLMLQPFVRLQVISQIFSPWDQRMGRAPLVAETAHNGRNTNKLYATYSNFVVRLLYRMGNQYQTQSLVREGDQGRTGNHITRSNVGMPEYRPATNIPIKAANNAFANVIYRINNQDVTDGLYASKNDTFTNIVQSTELENETNQSSITANNNFTNIKYGSEYQYKTNELPVSAKDTFSDIAYSAGNQYVIDILSATVNNNEQMDIIYRAWKLYESKFSREIINRNAADTYHQEGNKATTKSIQGKMIRLRFRLGSQNLMQNVIDRSQNNRTEYDHRTDDRNDAEKLYEAYPEFTMRLLYRSGYQSWIQNVVRAGNQEQVENRVARRKIRRPETHTRESQQGLPENRAQGRRQNLPKIHAEESRQNQPENRIRGRRQKMPEIHAEESRQNLPENRIWGRRQKMPEIRTEESRQNLPENHIRESRKIEPDDHVERTVLSQNKDSLEIENWDAIENVYEAGNQGTTENVYEAGNQGTTENVYEADNQRTTENAYEVDNQRTIENVYQVDNRPVTIIPFEEENNDSVDAAEVFTNILSEAWNLYETRLSHDIVNRNAIGVYNQTAATDVINNDPKNNFLTRLFLRLNSQKRIQNNVNEDIQKSSDHTFVPGNGGDVNKFYETYSNFVLRLLYRLRDQSQGLSSVRIGSQGQTGERVARSKRGLSRQRVRGSQQNLQENRIREVRQSFLENRIVAGRQNQPGNDVSGSHQNQPENRIQGYRQNERYNRVEESVFNQTEHPLVIDNRNVIEQIDNRNATGNIYETRNRNTFEVSNDIFTDAVYRAGYQNETGNLYEEASNTFVYPVYRIDNKNVIDNLYEAFNSIFTNTGYRAGSLGQTDIPFDAAADTFTNMISRAWNIHGKENNVPKLLTFSNNITNQQNSFSIRLRFRLGSQNLMQNVTDRSQNNRTEYDHGTDGRDDTDRLHETYPDFTIRLLYRSGYQSWIQDFARAGNQRQAENRVSRRKIRRPETHTRESQQYLPESFIRRSWQDLPGNRAQGRRQNLPKLHAEESRQNQLGNRIWGRRQKMPEIRTEESRQNLPENHIRKSRKIEPDGHVERDILSQNNDPFAIESWDAIENAYEAGNRPITIIPFEEENNDSVDAAEAFTNILSRAWNLYETKLSHDIVNRNAIGVYNQTAATDVTNNEPKNNFLTRLFLRQIRQRRVQNFVDGEIQKSSENTFVQGNGGDVNKFYETYSIFVIRLLYRLRDQSPRQSSVRIGSQGQTGERVARSKWGLSKQRVRGSQQNLQENRIREVRQSFLENYIMAGRQKQPGNDVSGSHQNQPGNDITGSHQNQPENRIQRYRQNERYNRVEESAFNQTDNPLGTDSRDAIKHIYEAGNQNTFEVSNGIFTDAIYRAGYQNETGNLYEEANNTFVHPVYRIDNKNVINNLYEAFNSIFTNTGYRAGSLGQTDIPFDAAADTFTNMISRAWNIHGKESDVPKRLTFSNNITNQQNSFSIRLRFRLGSQNLMQNGTDRSQNNRTEYDHGTDGRDDAERLHETYPDFTIRLLYRSGYQSWIQDVSRAGNQRQTENRVARRKIRRSETHTRENWQYLPESSIRGSWQGLPGNRAQGHRQNLPKIHAEESRQNQPGNRIWGRWQKMPEIHAEESRQNLPENHIRERRKIKPDDRVGRTILSQNNDSFEIENWDAIENVYEVGNQRTTENAYEVDNQRAIENVYRAGNRPITIIPFEEENNDSVDATEAFTNILSREWNLYETRLSHDIVNRNAIGVYNQTAATDVINNDPKNNFLTRFFLRLNSQKRIQNNVNEDILKSSDNTFVPGNGISGNKFYETYSNFVIRLLYRLRDQSPRQSSVRIGSQGQTGERIARSKWGLSEQRVRGENRIQGYRQNERYNRVEESVFDQTDHPLVIDNHDAVEHIYEAGNQNIFGVSNDVFTDAIYRAGYQNETGNLYEGASNTFVHPVYRVDNKNVIDNLYEAFNSIFTNTGYGAESRDQTGTLSGMAPRGWHPNVTRVLRNRLSRNTAAADHEADASSERNVYETDTSQYTGSDSLIYRDRQALVQRDRQQDTQRHTVQIRTRELERDVREVYELLEEKDIELRETIERTDELERMLEQQEQIIQSLQERQNISIEQERRGLGMDFDHITPEFTRDWQLEKMRYGLD